MAPTSVPEGGHTGQEAEAGHDAGFHVDSGATDSPDPGAGDTVDRGATDSPYRGAGDTVDRGATDSPYPGAGDTVDRGATDSPDPGAGDTVDRGATDSPDRGTGGRAAQSHTTRGGVLPRDQAGSAPQHLLLTLLGDYWSGRTEHLPSAALVALLAEFGISSAGTRAALSRLSRRGLLVSFRQDRRTLYALSDRARAVLDEGGRHILAFGAEERPWSGTWTVVAFSVPEQRRDLRHRLRTRLRWLGLAPLYDGVWVSPHAGQKELAAALDELGVEAATVLTGAVIGRAGTRGDPLQAWDLEGLRHTYRDFIDRFSMLHGRVGAGAVGAAEGLRARTEIMDAWRNMPNLDPELPAVLLPDRWPRQEARQLFVDVYDNLGPVAELRIREILSGYSPTLAGLATHHTSALVRPGG